MLILLHSRAQVDEARQELNQLGCDTSVGWWRLRFSLLFLLRFRRAPEPVAVNKSWDVLQMLQFAEKYFHWRGVSVFEMGSFNSEISLVLWKRGFHRIRASDLNPLGRCIRWYGNQIDFRCENYYEPDIPDASIDLITALSVIEHGYDQDRFLSTCGRLLRPGGIICLTTDYHAEKIEVPDDYRIFHLSYQIFSKAEVESLLDEAAEHDLEPVGPIVWDDPGYPVEFESWRFTFVFIALRKRR